MLAKPVQVILVLGLLIYLGTTETAQAFEDAHAHLFSTQADVPPGSVATAFGLIPRDSYRSWYRAFAVGTDETLDVAQALFQDRAIRVKADVPLCPWGQYWTSAVSGVSRSRPLPRRKSRLDQSCGMPNRLRGNLSRRTLVREDHPRPGSTGKGSEGPMTRRSSYRVESSP
jgi:hypothetical protein